LVCAFPDLPPMVGYARTATIRSANPSGRGKEDDRKIRVGYYEYVASGPAPRICVIQDLDGEQAGHGAFWGEVQTNVHKALGCVGGVTDGSIRDIPMMAGGFQMLAGSVGPSHAHVHLVDFGGTVRVAGMIVRSGDLIHADRHGAVLVPHELAPKVVAAADLCARREAVLLEACRRPGFSIAELRQALQRMDEIH
jgi:regulator of RNase E activity RraA